MATMGDLVYRVTADTRSFGQGLQQATGQAKSFGSGMSSSLGQVGFAVQDFATVLGQGGANSLGRAIMSASNNIGMLGAAFGPWGMAISSGAAVLSATLIPALLKTKDAIGEVKAELKSAQDQIDDVFSHREKISDIKATGRVGTKESLQQTIDDVTRKNPFLQERAEFERTNLRDLGQTLFNRGDVFVDLATGDLVDKTERKFSELFTKQGHFRSDLFAIAKGAEGGEEFVGQAKRLRGVEQEIALLKERNKQAALGLSGLAAGATPAEDLARRRKLNLQLAAAGIDGAGATPAERIKAAEAAVKGSREAADAIANFRAGALEDGNTRIIDKLDRISQTLDSLDRKADEETVFSLN